MTVLRQAARQVHPCVYMRVRGEIVGPVQYENAGKSHDDLVIMAHRRSGVARARCCCHAARSMAAPSRRRFGWLAMVPPKNRCSPLLFTPPACSCAAAAAAAAALAAAS
jgi:hypothetical protein